MSHRGSREIEHIGSVHEEVELNDRFMAKHVTNGLGDCRLRDLTAKDVPAFLEEPAAVDPIPQASPQDPPRFHHVVCVSNKTIAEDAGDRSPDCSWGEWIAPISDPATAARMITSVLRTTPQPTHG